MLSIGTRPRKKKSLKGHERNPLRRGCWIKNYSLLLEILLGEAVGKVDCLYIKTDESPHIIVWKKENKPYESRSISDSGIR